MLRQYCVMFKVEGSVFKSKTSHLWIPAYLLEHENTPYTSSFCACALHSFSILVTLYVISTSMLEMYKWLNLDTKVFRWNNFDCNNVCVEIKVTISALKV